MDHGALPQWGHLPIGEIVHETEDVIVFINTSGKTEWATSPAYDAKLPADKKKKTQLRNRAAQVEASQTEFMSSANRQRFMYLIGEGYARWLEEDYISARQLFTDAENFVAARYLEASKTWYLASCLICVGIIALIWVIATARTETGLVGTFNESPTYGTALFLGAVGALLSAIPRVSHAKFDFGTERKRYYLEGGLRVITGMVAGAVALLAMHAGWLMPQALNGNGAGAFLLALAAGVSERFLPSVLSVVDRTSIKPSAEHWQAEN